MVHSRHFLRTNYVGAFALLIGWKIPVDVGVCFVFIGMRGGVSMVSHRHAVANNPYIDNYDETRPSSYLLYLDCTNLYGAAMSEALPTGGFEWVRTLWFFYSILLSVFFSCITSEENENLLMRRTIECKRLLVSMSIVQRWMFALHSINTHLKKWLIFFLGRTIWPAAGWYLGFVWRCRNWLHSWSECCMSSELFLDCLGSLRVFEALSFGG